MSDSEKIIKIISSLADSVNKLQKCIEATQAVTMANQQMIINLLNRVKELEK